MRMPRSISNAIARKVAVLGIATVSVLALTACESFSSAYRIGVLAGDIGTVHIVYLACDYERVTAVALHDGHDPATGDDNELVWEIRSEDGDNGGVFPVGSEPVGFVEVVPFDGRLSENMIAVVEIEGLVGEAIDFAPTELEPGMVYANGNPNSNMDPDAFEQRARESCQAAH
jgi:hypothetical protein